MVNFENNDIIDDFINVDNNSEILYRLSIVEKIISKNSNQYNDDGFIDCVYDAIVETYDKIFGDYDFSSVKNKRKFVISFSIKIGLIINKNVDNIFISAFI